MLCKLLRYALMSGSKGKQESDQQLTDERCLQIIIKLENALQYTIWVVKIK